MISESDFLLISRSNCVCVCSCLTKAPLVDPEGLQASAVTSSNCCQSLWAPQVGSSDQSDKQQLEAELIPGLMVDWARPGNCPEDSSLHTQGLEKAKTRTAQSGNLEEPMKSAGFEKKRRKVG